jgi:hypothetical protein
MMDMGAIQPPRRPKVKRDTLAKSLANPLAKLTAIYLHIDMTGDMVPQNLYVVSETEVIGGDEVRHFLASFAQDQRLRYRYP